MKLHLSFQYSIPILKSYLSKAERSILKLSKRYIVYGLLIFLTSHLIMAQTTTLNGVVNIYSPVTAINCNLLTVTKASGFKVGDEVLIIQMKGVAIDLSNSSSFGSIIDYKNTGNYEFSIIDSISGQKLFMKNYLLKNYSINDKVQIINVPHYKDAKVVSTLTALPWNGSYGGVLVFAVMNKLSLNANIDVSGLGFNGGRPSLNDYKGCSSMEYFFDSTSGLGGKKGESIANASILNYGQGRGCLANGGGGGNHVNSGGGGGSNFGLGGNGGYQWEGCPILQIGGEGGRMLSYTSKQNKIFMGGGGGGGQQNNDEGTPGTNGGGLIIIKADSILGNNFFIRADGKNNIKLGGKDGAGGGGGGGTILLNSSGFTQLNASAKGGDGGSVNGKGTCHGPGGGGGGGVIWVSGSFSNLIASVSGGQPGLNKDPVVKCFNTSFGAASGQDGATLIDLNLPIFSLLQLKSNMPLCNIDTCKISINTTLPLNSIYSWTGPFGFKANTTSLKLTKDAKPGMYYVNIVDSLKGCGPAFLDSIYVKFLMVRDTTISNSICDGQSYFGYRFSGIYIDTLKAANECDSIRTLILSVIKNSYTTINKTICQGQSFLGYNSTKTYLDTFINSNGCDSIRTLFLTVNPSYNQLVFKSICYGTAFKLADGNLVNSTGIYTSRIKTSLYCDSLITVSLTVLPKLKHSINKTDPTCFNDKNGTINILMKNGVPPFSFSVLNNINYAGRFNNLSAGKYKIIVQDAVGCLDTSQITLNQPLQFITKINPNDTNVEPDAIVQFRSTCSDSSASFLWSPKDYLTCFTCPNPISTTDKSIEYAILTTVINNGNSCTEKSYVNIRITPRVFIPNVFTPDGSGPTINEKLNIQARGFKEYSLRIFNRWGEKIYESNKIEEPWDGMYNGDICQSDIYLCQVEIIDFFFKKYVYSVTVNLVR